MAHAYTPGLKVKHQTIVEKTRRLPIPGEVLVKEGETVRHDQVVATTNVPGEVHLVNVANALTVDPADIVYCMKKKLSESVKKDEIIAMKSSFFGLFKSFVKAPSDGTIELISEVTGQVAVREPSIPVEITAYIPGKVTRIFPKAGVTIQTPAALIQGIFGVGGEAHGELHMVAKSPDEVLDPEKITADCKGKILIGGAIVTKEALQKARGLGLRMKSPQASTICRFLSSGRWLSGRN